LDLDFTVTDEVGQQAGWTPVERES
jgi:hypothetical protein